MKAGLNLSIGLANSIWSAIVAFAVVPIYLKYLGAESYGLIGFFTTTQALIALLDLGLSSTINREIAKSKSESERYEAAKLLHSLAIIYWSIAVLIMAGMMLLSGPIARHWLQAQQLPTDTVQHAIMLIGLVIACRWPIALYQGALMGSHRLALQSGINMVMTTLSSLGAILVLYLIAPTIEAYFIWQAIVGCLYAITIRLTAWKVVGRPHNLTFNLVQLKTIWKFSLGMTGIGFTSLVFTQLDKIILSKMLSLEEFGHYMLASMMVGSLYLLIIPVYNIVYPKLSALIANADVNNVIQTYCNTTRALLSVLFPIVMVLALFSESILTMWTGNLAISKSIAPIVSILAIGTGLHGAMYLPYALQLAYGKTSIPLKINLLLTVILVPLTIILTFKFGAIGSALAWMILHVCYLFIGTAVTHRELLHGLGVKWITQDVGIPLAISLVFSFVGYFFKTNYNYTSVYAHLLTAPILFVLTCVTSISTSKPLREKLFVYTKLVKN